MTTQEDNVALLRAWLDEYQRNGYEGASERFAKQLFDPEVEFSPFLARETEGRAYQGVDGVRTFFRELNDMLGEVRYEQPSAVRMGQDPGLVFQFREGRVRRLTACGSHEEALTAAKDLQRA